MSGEVRLRPIRFEDWAEVHEWMRRPEVSRYQPWDVTTEEDTRRSVQQGVDAWAARPQLVFAYVARMDGATVGTGQLSITNREHRRAEFGYNVDPRAWGRGVATAIGRELLRIGFEEQGMHRIEATCDPRNVASARVLEKLGLRFEGRIRENYLLPDGWRDSDVRGMLATEWRDRTA